jgi:hypothetical protein
MNVVIDHGVQIRTITLTFEIPPNALKDHYITKQLLNKEVINRS